jgi:histidinol dehydrogenase
MKRYILRELSQSERSRLLQRNPVFDPELLATCQEVFDQISSRGDEAIREYTRRWDKVEIDSLSVPSKQLSAAPGEIPAEVMRALETAAHNIRIFHSAQRLVEEPVEVAEGISCWRAARAIDSVGLYVPGGTAVLPSTVLMLGIPAKLAGCTKIILAVPPQADGSVAPSVLAAAQVAGIRQVFRIGGAQAVAAMALGTESVPRVDKILGPGNRFVQTAKLLATFHGVAIDMVAGPSEVLVIADAFASPPVVASDLISQAEHGPDSQVVLVSTSEALLDETLRELDRQLSDLPRRDLALASLEQSFTLLVDSLDEAFDFSNRYAPEHLILAVEKPRDWVGNVQNAGSVFVGSWSPEVAGDYASGTNHTLPTSGLARCDSGVSMDTFVKKITFQELSRQGLEDLAPTLEVLARLESLEGHARAVTTRLTAAERNRE